MVRCPISQPSVLHQSSKNPVVQRRSPFLKSFPLPQFWWRTFYIDLLEQSINALECTTQKQLVVLEKSTEVAMGTNEVATCALDESIHLFKEATNSKTRGISSELMDVKDNTRLLPLKFSLLHRNIAANHSADRSKI